MKTKEKNKESKKHRLPAISTNGSGDVRAEKHKVDTKAYEKELGRLQIELVKLQEWVKHEGLKVVVIFEGRDAAGKGGVIKYWFSVSDEEQERRFQKRMHDPTRSWKLSPMDLESRSRWVEYSKAKDTMFAHADIKQAPWYVVKADDKKCARLNCISHFLSMIPYGDLTPTPPALPPRPEAGAYVRPPIEDQTFVPEIW